MEMKEFGPKRGHVPDVSLGSATDYQNSSFLRQKKLT